VTPGRIRAESGTDERVGTVAQERKIKGQLPADLLSQKFKYIRPPKAASIAEITPASIMLCFQCHLLPLKK